MSAAPIARYLRDLHTGDDARVVSMSRLAGESRPADPIKEAHARGVESGKAEVTALMTAQLEERKASLRSELASAREEWVRLESTRLAEQLTLGLADIEERLAATVARILKPFLAVELQRKAIADLVENMTLVRSRDQLAAITVSGAQDLLEALRKQLEDKLGNITFYPNQGSDISVTVGTTVLETRLGAWMTRIEKAVR